MKKTDCFAYKMGGCRALNQMQCDTCRFYKPAGTECNTCPHKDKPNCKGCHDHSGIGIGL